MSRLSPTVRTMISHAMVRDSNGFINANPTSSLIRRPSIQQSHQFLPGNCRPCLHHADLACVSFAKTHRRNGMADGRLSRILRTTRTTPTIGYLVTKLRDFPLRHHRPSSFQACSLQGRALKLRFNPTHGASCCIDRSTGLQDDRCNIHLPSKPASRVASVDQHWY